jgi:hypothetical protein
VRCNKPTNLQMNVALSAGGQLTGSEAAIRVGICQRHQLLWLLGMGLGAVAWVAGYLGVRRFPQGGFDRPGTILAMALLALLFALPPIVFWFTRPVKATRIDPQFIWLKGFHRDYLRGLPPRRQWLPEHHDEPRALPARVRYGLLVALSD